MNDEESVPLELILRRYGFRQDRAIPVGNVWCRGRRSGRRFVAYIPAATGEEPPILTVTWANGRREGSREVNLDETTVAELEAMLHEVIRA